MWVNIAARLEGIADPAGICVFARVPPEPKQEYFADAITDDLTTDPSRIEASLSPGPRRSLTKRIALSHLALAWSRSAEHLPR